MGDKELKDTIILLENYKRLVAEVENLKIIIDEERNNYEGCTAMVFSESTSKTNKFSSVVENEIVAKEEKCARLEKELIKKKILLNKINNALNILSERESKIIALRYFNKIPSWEGIGCKLDLTGEYCRALNVDILKKLSRVIFIEKYI